MLRQVLIVLILYLLINQLILFFNEKEQNNLISDYGINSIDKDDLISDSDNESVASTKSASSVKSSASRASSVKSTRSTQKIEEIISLNLFGEPTNVIRGESILWTFRQPTPWTQIVYLYNQEYPFRFHIKLKVPSLNDYQAWKQIIPNLDFDPQKGEIVIPSRNEESALAIANLMLSNFGGQISIQNILEKNLIEISITKALQYDLVKTKLREQILESLQGKSLLDKQQDYEQDLAKKSKNESFDDVSNSIEIEAYEGGEYAYL